MPMTEMVVMVAVTSALVLGFIALLRLLATVITHKTIRKAVETDPQLAEGLLQKLTDRKERSGDDRLALILLAIGVAMAAAPIIAIDDPGIVRVALAASLFPLLVGATLWLRFRAVERAQRRDRGE
jgi:membrane associated rhomboid family serine protease